MVSDKALKFKSWLLETKFPLKCPELTDKLINVMTNENNKWKVSYSEISLFDDAREFTPRFEMDFGLSDRKFSSYMEWSKITRPADIKLNLIDKIIMYHYVRDVADGHSKHESDYDKVISAL